VLGDDDFWGAPGSRRPSEQWRRAAARENKDQTNKLGAAEYRSKFAWRRLARKGKDEAAEVSAALQIILKIERVPFQV
jgi:hypothetical protein